MTRTNCQFLVVWAWIALPISAGFGVDILHTFDADNPRGPYADAWGADGFHDAVWWWDGTPRLAREQPIFGQQSLVTEGLTTIRLKAAGDLGASVTFAAHLRNISPGVNTLFSNWQGTPSDGTVFIAFDPSSQYEADGIFLRFHHWRQTSSGLESLELSIPPLADWSNDNQPHHITVTYDRGKVTAYLDARELGQVKADQKAFDRLVLCSSSQPLLFGSMPGGRSFPLIGMSDDVLILSRALSPAEIRTLRDQGAVEAGLVRPGPERPLHNSHPKSTPLVSDAEIKRQTSALPVESADGESEWTLEAAHHRWKPMVRPVEHVGIPGYNWQTGVMWDGSLVIGPLSRPVEAEVAPLGDNLLHLSVGFGEPMRFLDRHGTNSPAIRRSLAGGRLPIPTVESHDGDLVWRETVFAHLLDRRPEDGMIPAPDDTLVTHMCWKVRNTGYAARTGHLWLFLGDTSQVTYGYKCQVREALDKPLPHRLHKELGMMEGKVRYALPVPAKGAVRQHDKIPAPEGLSEPVRNVLEWKIDLAPGEEAELRMILPYGLVEKVTGERLLTLDSRSLLAEVQAFWQGVVYREGQITTPDPFVNDYLVAVAGHMAEQVAFRHHPRPGIWMYKTSPGWYEHYWPCNAAKALPTFDFRGLTDLNRKVLQSFIDLKTDDIRGLDRSELGKGKLLRGEGFAEVNGFLGNFREWTANPLLLSHGLGMWALAAHFRVTRDTQWLGQGPGSPLETMIEAFDWVGVQRRRTMREENGAKVDHWGLLPAASAHDWLAGSTIFNDAFCIYGMQEIVRLLAEVGHPRESEMKQELNDYRACVQRNYAAARDAARPVPLFDGRSLPFVPRMIGELNWERIDWTYTGYGPLRAGAWGALDPSDPLVDQSLAFLEAGVPRGFGPILGKLDSAIGDGNFIDVSNPDAERHWLWRHYVEYETMWPLGGPLFLARDDLPRLFEWLFNNLAAVLHHDWRVGVESVDGVPSCAPGDGERWQLIRRMFINETGGWDGSQQDLFLFQAIPRSWLRPSDQLSVRKMRTMFGGMVDLHMAMAANGDQVNVDAKLALEVEPAQIRMRLRSGDGRPLRSATVNDRAAAVQKGDVVLLPQERQASYRIVGRFD